MVIQKVLHKFANNTTLHGAAHIIHAKMWHVRLFWIVILACTMIMFSLQMSQLLFKFFRYEKRTVVEMRQLDDSTYPWITVCRRRSLDAVTLQQIYYVFQHNESERQKIVANIDNQFVQSFNSFYDNVIVKAEKLINSYEFFPNIIYSMNQSVLEHGIAHFDNVFIATEFKGLQFHQIHFLNGLCFTFKFQGVPDLNGPVASMAVVDDQQLLPGEEERSKVPRIIDNIFGNYIHQSVPRVYIHPPHTHPLTIDSLQYNEVIRRKITTFYIYFHKMERLDVPYGNCADEYPFEPHPVGNYSAETCREWCLQDKIISNCGCKYQPLLHLQNDNETNNVSVCLSLGYDVYMEDEDVTRLIHQLQNIQQCLMAVDSWHKQCDDLCLQSCNELVIDATVKKTSLSPHMLTHLVPDYVNSLTSRNDIVRLQLLEKLSEGKFVTSSERNNLRFNSLLDDIAHMNFVLKNDMKIITETPDYTIIQLLSDIGGQLGLWTGMSVVTVVELLNLVLELVAGFRSIHKTQKTPRKNSKLSVTEITSARTTFDDDEEHINVNSCSSNDI